MPNLAHAHVNPLLPTCTSPGRIYSPPEPASPLQIGVIKALHEPSSDASGAPTRDMTVNWYYRPNEVIGGRKVQYCPVLLPPAGAWRGMFCSLGERHGWVV